MRDANISIDEWMMMSYTASHDIDAIARASDVLRLSTTYVNRVRRFVHFLAECGLVTPLKQDRFCHLPVSEWKARHCSSFEAHDDHEPAAGGRLSRRHRSMARP